MVEGTRTSCGSWQRSTVQGLDASDFFPCRILGAVHENEYMATLNLQSYDQAKMMTYVTLDEPNIRDEIAKQIWKKFY